MLGRNALRQEGARDCEVERVELAGRDRRAADDLGARLPVRRERRRERHDARRSSRPWGALGRGQVERLELDGAHPGQVDERRRERAPGAHHVRAAEVPRPVARGPVDGDARLGEGRERATDERLGLDDGHGRREREHEPRAVRGVVDAGRQWQSTVSLERCRGCLGRPRRVPGVVHVYENGGGDRLIRLA